MPVTHDSDGAALLSRRDRPTSAWRSRIAVYQRAEDVARYAPLFNALSGLYTADFVDAQRFPIAECDAGVITGTTDAEAQRIAPPDVPCLAFVGPHVSLSRQSDADMIFQAASVLSTFFHGARLTEGTVRVAAQLNTDGGEVVARKGDWPVWLVRRGGAASLQIVGTELPRLDPEEPLFRHFGAENWARCLPLINFMSQVSGWRAPAVRASFIFDDPNLHWTSYGHIDYVKVARHAESHDYHVAFATIPLDAWYVNRRASRLFRENSSRLSLVVHGNNHTYFELARRYTPAARSGLATQALRRIARLERVSGLQVPRVMTAPHGACTCEVADALTDAGFEAACISRSSLMIRNPGSKWPREVGLTPSEILGRGLPVFPRFNIRWDAEIWVRLAALLGQPVVPVGHHDDLEQWTLIERVARLINRMGSVQWCDFNGISRGNYLMRQVGDVVYVRVYSRNVEIRVPPNCSGLFIEGPLANVYGAKADDQQAGVDGMFPVSPDTTVSLKLNGSVGAARFSGPMPRTPGWAIVRRQMCEARDRARPILQRVLPRR